MLVDGLQVTSEAPRSEETAATGAQVQRASGAPAPPPTSSSALSSSLSQLIARPQLGQHTRRQAGEEEEPPFLPFFLLESSLLRRTSDADGVPRSCCCLCCCFCCRCCACFRSFGADVLLLRRGKKSGVATPDVAVGRGAASPSPSWAKTATTEVEEVLPPPLMKKLAALLAAAEAKEAESASAV